MAFRKAKPMQAYIKALFYGDPGRGKTFTSLLVAEGLSQHINKRIAFVDTERGTDFYAQHVPERKPHPEPFDFDAIYTRSLSEVANELKSLDPNEHGIIVIDSITHLWEAAKESYNGRTNRAGQIPLWAWASIKKPYKQLQEWLLNCPFHVIQLSRKGLDYQEDEETGESKVAGAKPKAEGETSYEPHIIGMFQDNRARNGAYIPTLFLEKDRTGVLAFQRIEWPNYDNTAAKWVPYLGIEQAQVETLDEAASKDAEAAHEREVEREKFSTDLLRRYRAQADLCEDITALDKLGKDVLTPNKKNMRNCDLAEAKTFYQKRVMELGG